MTPLEQLRAERAARTPEERKALEDAWKKENAEAIAVYNKEFERRGPLLRPIWLPEDK